MAHESYWEQLLGLHGGVRVHGGRGSTCDSWRGTDVFLFVCVILYFCSNLAESCAGLLSHRLIFCFLGFAVCAHTAHRSPPRQAVSVPVRSRVTPTPEQDLSRTLDGRNNKQEIKGKSVTVSRLSRVV